MKAVFTTKVEPTYQDLPERQYHFPRTYLRQAEAALGDWIVYYEPRRSSGDLSSGGGRQSYFAIARLRTIEADPVLADHFYAFVSDYLDFDRPVPFKIGARYFESGLVKQDGSTNKGAFGRAVRNISDDDYDAILSAGFGHVLGHSERLRVESDPPEQPTPFPYGFEEAGAQSFDFDPPRQLVSQLITRRFRDRAFAAAVKTAYRDTCAITGLKIINGGGRSEVQAAHIRPVAHDGPDSVRNGIALSGTFHWMFDRGLIGIDEDCSILVARDRVPDTVSRFVPEGRKLAQTVRAEERPHPEFLRYHRERVFKG